MEGYSVMKKNHPQSAYDKSSAAAAEAQIVDVGAAPEEAAVPSESDTTATGNDFHTVQHELAEMNDKFLRLNADFENFRKRTYKDITAARSAAVADTVQPFLHVLDIFNMALASINSSPNIDAIKQGMEMIMTEYGRVIQELGVVKVEAVGQQFDPSLHEAMDKEPSDKKEGTVIKQWACGYKMGDRLLRPARVVVSNGQAEK